MDKESFLDADQILRLNEVLQEISHESDRAAAILIGVEINDALERAIQAYLLPPPDRKDRLFSHDGPLGSFSSCIDLAYRLGLISGTLRREIHLIRRVRNEFAHRTAGLTFDDSPVADYCRELHIAKWAITGREAMQDALQLDRPRNRFALTGCATIAMLSGLPKRTNRVIPKPAEFGGERPAA
ncbi:MAG: MltR family transcriptional regulator [Candidatus Latescibacterota bacterium]